MFGHGRFALIDAVRSTDALGLLRELEAIQFESPAAIRQRQEESQAEYFKVLTKVSPFYREYHSFAQLPIIDKDFVKRHRQQLINPDYRGKLMRKKTGGSTGIPFVYSTGTYSHSYLWAGILLSWRAIGYQLGEPVVFLAGSSLFGSGFKQAVYHKLMNTRVFSAFDLSPERMRIYAETIASDRVRLLYGYASAIYRLAQYLLSSPRRLHFVLRGVVCTAEVLTPTMRNTIESAFGAICVNQYGCHEAGVSAYECEHRRGFHLITTRCYPEVLDDGALISTDLSNHAFFMPRYDTGDLVVMENNQCSCGRGFPLIREVIGRSNDMVSDPAGNTVHSAFFGILIREDSRISAFQVIFDERKLIFNLHCRERGVDWSNYLRQVRAVLKFDDIRIVENLSFKTPTSGKHRYVVRVDDVDATLAEARREQILPLLHKGGE
ncbi:MAG: phenylacetate--CoA ligase family protein [Nitrosospira sp.]|nr:phenylacetate--CoA ligase family protein [Nitrosospira sp.]